MSSAQTNEPPTEPASVKSGRVESLPTGPADQVKPGQIWRNRYAVKSPVDESGGRWYNAVDSEQGCAVLLRLSGPSRPAGRTAVWQKILDGSPPHVQRPLAVHEAGEWVEVWEAPRGQTLRSWRAAAVPDRERLTPVIRQLTAAFEALHFSGVGHFSLNPDAVFIWDSPSGPMVTLAGFDTAALYEGNALVPIAVDAFTAPPEAAGLFQHSPGELLRGWDWWSLGRLLQELVLGGPVVEHLPEMQRLRPLPVCATALLSEREIPGVRAGGVELMPDLDPALAPLLRGLLTTAPTGRWGSPEIKEWLAGRPPPDRYAAGRHEQFFRFQGRGYTVPEFARILQAAPVADEGIRHLFAREDKATVAFFLHETAALADLEQRLDAARELPGATALKPFAEPLRKELAAAVAWQGLGGGAFAWRGQPLSDAKLREQMKSADGFQQWHEVLFALATPLVLNYIAVHDPEAVRLLERLVKTAGEAEELATKSRWLKPKSPAAQAALWLAALEPDVALLAAQQKLQQEYAASDDAAFQTIFVAEKPTRVMQVLLAWAATDPRTFRLVSHEEMRQRRQKALVGEGEGVARLIFWLRLDRAMRAGPWLFGGRWLLVVAGLVLVSLLAVHVPGPWGVALGLLPLLLLAAARLAVNRCQSGLVKDWSPDSAPWGWRDGPGRSAKEVAVLAAKQGVPATPAGARAALARVTAELAKLATGHEPVRPPQPPRQVGTWGVVIFGWLVVLGVAAGSIQRALAHPPSWVAHVSAWQKVTEKSKPAKPDKPVEPGGIKISWPYKVPPDAYEITIRGSFSPTAEQTAAAIRKGKALVYPYKPETISSLVAIYVPLEDGLGGLLLFDGKKGALLGHDGVKINFVPFPRTGMQVGDQQAFFVEN